MMVVMMAVSLKPDNKSSPSHDHDDENAHDYAHDDDDEDDEDADDYAHDDEEDNEDDDGGLP